jgi:hypothetical protein
LGGRETLGPHPPTIIAQIVIPHRRSADLAHKPFSAVGMGCLLAAFGFDPIDAK